MVFWFGYLEMGNASLIKCEAGLRNEKEYAEAMLIQKVEVKMGQKFLFVYAKRKARMAIGVPLPRSSELLLSIRCDGQPQLPRR